MKQMGGNPHYTEYNGLGHLIGPKAYSQPDLYPWLFQQALSTTALRDAIIKSPPSSIAIT